MKKFFIVVLAIMLGVQSLSYAKTKGYEKSIEVNGGIGLDSYSRFSFGISMANGYRFNPTFYVGAVIGYEYFKALYMHSYEYKEYSNRSYDVKDLIKIGARVKANLTKGKISPFLNFDIGAGIQVAHTKYYSATGLYIAPAFGIDFKLNDNDALYLMLGYHAQNNQYGWFDNTDIENWTEEVLAGLFEIRIGFTF